MEKIFHVGDKVEYFPYGFGENNDGNIYAIEKDYGDGVYLIGNADSFVDLVNQNELRIKK